MTSRQVYTLKHSTTSAAAKQGISAASTFNLGDVSTVHYLVIRDDRESTLFIFKWDEVCSVWNETFRYNSGRVYRFAHISKYNDRSFRRARSEPLAKPMLTKASTAEIRTLHFQVHPIKVQFFNMSPKLQVEYCMKEYGSPHLAAISMHILCTSE